MPTNKHATIRYKSLDRCFRNPGRKYFIEDLVEACSSALYDYNGMENGVKRRQVLEDIKFMESEQGWSIPLERTREKHRVYFRYSDTSFSINNQPLNDTEANQLREALLTLSRFRGMPQFEWVEEITTRIDSELSLSAHSTKIIEFDQNQYLKGLEHISPIYTAILNQQTLNLVYQSFKSNESQTFIFHPYYLKQYNNRWYVWGMNHDTQWIMNLALDRITEIKEGKTKYTKNKEIDFAEYFEDIIGVTKNKEDEPEKIILKISQDLFPYIETKPLHGSQKIIQRETSFTIISLELIPNYELESLILSYGPGMIILEPKTLKDNLLAKIEKMKTNYSETMQIECTIE
jgi:predicted DNA-binding transcriptional regulator YafY